jgi:hypothetical protein
MKKKILIIGNYETRWADTCKWDETILNLTDYELVIIDTNSLYKTLTIQTPGIHYLKEWTSSIVQIKSNCSFIRKKIIESLMIDTKIFVLFNPEATLHRYANDSEYDLYTNSWLPFKIRTYIENGTTIDVKEESYQEYFKKLKVWKYYFLQKEVSDDNAINEFYSPKSINLERKELATNKIGKPIALEFYALFQKYSRGDYDILNSRIILLPSSSQDNSDDIDTIISMTKSFSEAEEPEWVINIKLPHETAFKQELAATAQRLEEQKSRYVELIKHKRLLYDYSYSLQDICQSTLAELGIIIKPSIVSDEFIIEHKNKEILVEVKGRNRSIDKDDLGQLVIDIGRHFQETGKPISGLFIGNGWRNLPLDKRETKQTLTFPNEIIEASLANNLGLLSGYELFNAYCKILNGELKTDEFLDLIFNTKGPIRIKR